MQATSSRPSKFSIIVSVVALAIAAYLAWTGYQTLNDDLAEVKWMAGSTDWPTTQAIITESAIEIGKEQRRSEVRTTYYPRISYKYSVGGRSYTSDRVSFGTSMVHTFYDKDKPDASWVVNLYPTGSAHTVYYAPTKNSESVLVPGVMPLALTLPSLINLAFAPAIVVVVVVLLVLGDIDTTRRRLIFVVCSVVVAFSTMAIAMQTQKQLVESAVPEQKLLRCETDAYYIGQKKFKY